MKISDPLGKVYQHTMFKKKSYNIPKGSEEEYLDKNKTHSEDEDDASDVSDQSDDSLSTKSSRIVPSSRARSSSRRRGREGVEGEERDREDAISYASRQRNGESGRQRERSSKRETKKFGREPLGPPGTSYSLWTSQRSVKRDHKRKFNRSLCGVLLGVSILLVILGILGIIGIAVYLGVVQKIESPSQDKISIDGAFRVVSDDFSLSLLNPLSPVYRENSEKYSEMIATTYRKSYLRDAFVKVTIDGFSSGSIKVFFKVILDKKFLPGRSVEDPVTAARDVLVQEVMALESSQFQGETIDIDSIEFSLSEVQDTTGAYLEPEPLQGEQEQQEVANSPGTMWQTLALSSTAPPPGPAWQGGAASRYGGTGSRHSTPAPPSNSGGWSLPRYPTNMAYDQGRGSSLLSSPQLAVQPGLLTPAQPATRSSVYSRAGPAYSPRSRAQQPARSGRPASPGQTGLMSDQMQPPPPPPAGLTLERLFSRQEPPSQTAAPSEQSVRRTSSPQPRIQNRRLDQGGQDHNGFWRMSQGRRQEEGGNKQEQILELQAELQQLLRLEQQQQQQQQQQQNSVLYRQIQALDEQELQQLADQLLPGSPSKIGSQDWTALPQPGRPAPPVSITNFGTSGLKPVVDRTGGFPTSSPRPHSPTSTVVDIHVPQNQDTGFFGVGSSLSFSDTQAAPALMNSVASLNRDQVVAGGFALGDDPNIVYPQQIRAGTEMRQGPQGPIVSSPAPLPRFVTQTPHAPDFGPSRAAPRPTPRPPARPVQPTRTRPPASRRVESGVRRQDLLTSLLPAAAGLSATAGISPVGIFSNLLNAYATIGTVQLPQFSFNLQK